MGVPALWDGHGQRRVLQLLANRVFSQKKKNRFAKIFALRSLGKNAKSLLFCEISLQSVSWKNAKFSRNKKREKMRKFRKKIMRKFHGKHIVNIHILSKKTKFRDYKTQIPQKFSRKIFSENMLNFAKKFA